MSEEEAQKLRRRKARPPVLGAIIALLIAGAFGWWAYRSQDLGIAIDSAAIGMLIVLGVVMYYIRKPRGVAELQRQSDEYHQQYIQVENFPTAKGLVTVTWRPHLDVAARVRAGSDPSSMLVGHDAADFIESDPDRKDGDVMEESLPKLREKITSVLAGNPEADLSQYESAIGIKVLRVDRSWTAAAPTKSTVRELAMKAAEEQRELDELLNDPNIPEKVKKKLRNRGTSLDRDMDS